jgi:hypothetical protein
MLRAQKNPASRFRGDASAVEKHRSCDLNALLRVAIDAQWRATHGETERTGG